MEIINLTKEEFLNMLFNKEPFNIGYFGILCLKDEKLYKINYRDFIDVYLKNSNTEIDELVEMDLKINKKIGYKYKDPKYRIEEFTRLKDTMTNDLITGVLSYRNLYVGVVMNYYKDYVSLMKVADGITLERLYYFINRAALLLYDLMDHGIIPRDIKEDNILVNLNTNDVKLIDLDDINTIYGPFDYVKQYPNHKSSIKASIVDMTKRLTVGKRKVKTLSDEFRNFDWY